MDELPQVLWAHRTTLKSSNGETSFNLVYGLKAVVPIEVSVETKRIKEFKVRQNEKGRREDLDILEDPEIHKAEFQGKMGPTWEGPYVVKKTYGDGAYKLETLSGSHVDRTWKGRYCVYVPELHKKPQRLEEQYDCMTRISTKELLTPFKNPEREFRSTRKLFKTSSLDDLSSPEFDLFSYLEDQFEEEVKEELRDNTFSGLDNEDANEHIEKVLEIVDLFYIPKINQDQLMLRAFPMSLTRAASRWLRNEPSSSIITWEVLMKKFLSKYCPPARTSKKMEEINNFQQEHDETLYQAWKRFKEILMRCPQHYLIDMQDVILFYMGLDVPTRQILDSKGVIPIMKAADVKKAIQEMADHSQKWHNGTEIKKVNEKVYAAQVGCESCGGPYYSKDCLLKEEGKTLEEAYTTLTKANNGRTVEQIMAESAKSHDENSNLTKEIQVEKGSGSLSSSTETNPGDHVKSISTTIDADTPSIRRINLNRYAVSSLQNMTHIFEPNRSVVPFLSRLSDDTYEEMDVLDSATYLKKMLRERPKMRYQIEASTNKNNSVVLEDPLTPKEKDLESFTLPCNIINNYFEKALADLGASVSVMPLTTFTNLAYGELAPMKLTVELADRPIKHPKGMAENKLVGIAKFVFPVDFIILDIPEDVIVPLIFERPFLSTAHAKIDMFIRMITLRVGNDKITFKSAKPASSLINRVYVLGLRERMDLDLEARIMGEALILNRSLDPEFEDFIELNDLNGPLELRRNQLWRAWMFTVMRRWEMSLLENHFVELHVLKQGDSKDLLPFTMAMIM
ncbi:hypothetical protein Tco_0597012 [Tanacetum coccineum]